MTVSFVPSHPQGSVIAPPSKSMAHRLLICAGLAHGESVVHGVSGSEDVKATLACLSALGAVCTVENDTVRVKGCDPRKASPATPLPCNESGSTLRFFAPLALLANTPIRLTGAPSLFRRPMEVYEKACAERGLLFDKQGETLTVCGPLPSGEYRVAGNISSQFISGLLFALPLLPHDSTVYITTAIESRSYIGLTIAALGAFGVTVTWQDDRTLFVKGNQKYCPTETTVEGDYSNAAFFAAMAAMGDAVSVTGLDTDSLQGDKVYERYMPMLVRGTPTIHIGDCPDLGPILFALAAVHHGAVFTGTSRLRIKESDRAAVMASELEKLGTTVTVSEDSVVIYPSDFHPPVTPVCGHNDHRIVMSMAVLLTHTGGVIEGAEAVSKSFPDFFDRLAALGVKMAFRY